MSRPQLDITGRVFGRLTALSEGGRGSSGQILWRCRCECGTERLFGKQKLLAGHTRSCGCLQRERSRERITRHGMSETPTYTSWSAMVGRCINANDDRFMDYGGRGVKVCERWRTFENFLADMGERPTGTSLDRYPDKNGNYEPGNCRWATAKQQQRNRRVNRILELDGKSQTATEWAEQLGVAPTVIYTRLRRGWSVERTLREPPAISRSR